MNNTPIFDPQASLDFLLDDRRKKQEDETLVREYVRNKMGRAIEEVAPGIERVYERLSEVLGSDEFLEAKTIAVSEGLGEQFFKQMGESVRRELRDLYPSSAPDGEDFDFSMIVLRRMAHDLLAGPLKEIPHHGSNPQAHYKSAWRMTRRLAQVATTWEIEGLDARAVLSWDMDVLRAFVGGSGHRDWLDAPIEKAQAQRVAAFNRGVHLEIKMFRSLEVALKGSRDVLLDLQNRHLVPHISQAMGSLRKGDDPARFKVPLSGRKLNTGP